MSELKEHLFCECDECIREYRGPLSNEMRPYYLKSEADKVIAELKEERRWRKVREELPTDEDAVAVCFHTEDGRLITSVDCFFDGEWQMMDDPEGYWMPLPKAPKEENERTKSN